MHRRVAFRGGRKRTRAVPTSTERLRKEWRLGGVTDLGRAYRIYLNEFLLGTTPSCHPKIERAMNKRRLAAVGSILAFVAFVAAAPGTIAGEHAAHLTGGDSPPPSWEYWSECEALEDYCDSRARHVMGQDTCWYCPDLGIKVRWCQDEETKDCGHDGGTSCGGKVECRRVEISGVMTCCWNDCDFAIGGCPKVDCQTSRPHQLP